MLPKHIVPNAKFVTITRFNPLKVTEWTESVISALGFLDALHFLTRRYIQAPYEKTIDEKALKKLQDAKDQELLAAALADVQELRQDPGQDDADAAADAIAKADKDADDQVEVKDSVQENPLQAQINSLSQLLQDQASIITNLQTQSVETSPLDADKYTMNVYARNVILDKISSHKIFIWKDTMVRETKTERNLRLVSYRLMYNSVNSYPLITHKLVTGDILELWNRVMNYRSTNMIATAQESLEKLLQHRKSRRISFPDWLRIFHTLVDDIRHADMELTEKVILGYFVKLMKNDERYDNVMFKITHSSKTITVAIATNQCLTTANFCKDMIHTSNSIRSYNHERYSNSFERSLLTKTEERSKLSNNHNNKGKYTNTHDRNQKRTQNRVRHDKAVLCVNNDTCNDRNCQFSHDRNKNVSRAPNKRNGYPSGHTSARHNGTRKERSYLNRYTVTPNQYDSITKLQQNSNRRRRFSNNRNCKHPLKSNTAIQSHSNLDSASSVASSQEEIFVKFTNRVCEKNAKIGDRHKIGKHQPTLSFSRSEDIPIVINEVGRALDTRIIHVTPQETVTPKLIDSGNSAYKHSRRNYCTPTCEETHTPTDLNTDSHKYSRRSGVDDYYGLAPLNTIARQASEEHVERNNTTIKPHTKEIHKTLKVLRNLHNSTTSTKKESKIHNDSAHTSSLSYAQNRFKGDSRNNLRCKSTNTHVEKCYMNRAKRPINSRESTTDTRAQPNTPLNYENDSWILDSGTSCHLTNDLSNLHSVRRTDVLISTSNSDQSDMRARKVGTVIIQGENDTLELHNVLYCKYAASNLISIPRLCDEGLTVIFEQYQAIIMKGAHLILKITRINDERESLSGHHNDQNRHDSTFNLQNDVFREGQKDTIHIQSPIKSIRNNRQEKSKDLYQKKNSIYNNSNDYNPALNELQHSHQNLPYHHDKYPLSETHLYEMDKSHLIRQKTRERAYKNQHRVDTEPKNRKSMDSDSKLTLLHERIGHTNFERLKHIYSIGNNKKMLCTSCTIAKITNLPYAKSQRKATRPLQIVSSDVCGPFYKRDNRQQHSFITFIDHFTGYVKTVPIHTQKQWPHEFRIFKKESELAFQPHKITTLRTDNAGVMISLAFENYLREEGIRHELTLPYQHSQNGKVERVHRTLVESAQAMRHHAGMGIEFLMPAIEYATYIYNLLPQQKHMMRSKDKNRTLTPYEHWEGYKTPNIVTLYENLKTFGCEVVHQIPNEKRTKDQYRGKLAIFLGKARHSKGHKLLDPTTGNIFSSRTIVANESSYPFSKQHSNILKYKEPGGEMHSYPALSDIMEPVHDQCDEVLNDGHHELPNTDHTSNMEEWYASDYDTNEVYNSDTTEEAHDIDQKHNGDTLDCESAEDSSNNDNATFTERDEIPPSTPCTYTLGTRLMTTEGEAVLKEIYDDGDIGVSWPDYEQPDAVYTIDKSHAWLPSNKETSLLTVEKSKNTFQYEPHKIYTMNDLKGVVNADETELPRFHHQVFTHPLRNLIKDAEDLEYQTLVNKGCWSKAIDLPEGHKALALTWNYRAKPDEHGKLKQIKARLCLRGDLQKTDLTKAESYSPVMHFSTLKLLFALYCKNKAVTFYQIDITAAYLSALVRRETYIKMPPGREIEGQEGKVYRLLRALYGGKDSGRCFYEALVEHLTSNNFHSIHQDQCLYIFEKEGSFIKIVFFVDDIAIATTGGTIWKDFLAQLGKRFDYKLNNLTHFLGTQILIDKEKGEIHMDQTAQIDKMLRQFNMQDCKPANSPVMNTTQPSQLDLPKTDVEKKEAENIPYRQAVGHLLYVQGATRPDIAYPLKIASKFCKGWGKQHWLYVKHIMRYLKGTRERKVIFRGIDGTSANTSDLLQIYTDASHQGDQTFDLSLHRKIRR